MEVEIRTKAREVDVRREFRQNTQNLVAASAGSRRMILKATMPDAIHNECLGA